MTWDDLGRSATSGHWPQFSDSILHATRSQCLRVFRMAFVQEKRLSIFSHWLIMEKEQNRPELRSPTSVPKYTVYTYRYSYQSLKVSRRSFSRCSYRRAFKLFLRWDHLTWHGDLTLSNMGMKLSHVWKRCMNSCAKTAVFLNICDKLQSVSEYPRRGAG